MSTDDSIFLVSMCGTPEEFLAAFRRYVDRHGLFIPTATPAPALHSGRFAITLVDGSVMIEGEAEVASSSPRPSALYGRTGMTLHFTAVDDASKQSLAALDKAKLSIKVTSQAAGLTPRPSRLTAPVTHPPAKAAGAAADKTLALAECVVVGDLGALTPGRGAKAAAKPGAPKFAIPPIGPTGSSPAVGASVGPNAATRSLVQEEAIVSTQTGVPPAPGGTPTASSPPIAASASQRSPAISQMMDDGPSEATEVGPIVEEASIQPSGPTITSVVIVSPPPSPEAMAAVAMADGKVPVDEELETTMGGPPPMPPSAGTGAAGVVPSAVARQASGPVRPPIGGAAGRASTAGMYSFTKPAPAGAATPTASGRPATAPMASGSPATPAVSARPATAPMTGGAPVAAASGVTSGATARPSTPAIPPIGPLPGRASTPAIPAAPPGALAGQASGPAQRPSSHSLKNGNGLSGPVTSPLGGGPSGAVAAPAAAAPSTATASPLSGPVSGSPSAPPQRPSAHVIRNGQAAGATGQAPALRPSVPAIAPSMASSIAPAMASGPSAAPKADGAAPIERTPDRGDRGDRVTSSGIRRTVLGIAATYVEPAPTTAAPAVGEDVAAVPEAVHDSMFETAEPDLDIDLETELDSAAIPEASDMLATRREGAPRPPPRQPTAAASPPPVRRTLDSAFDDSDGRAALAAAPSGRPDTSVSSGVSVRPMTAPLPSLAKARTPTSQLPPMPTASSRPPSAPGRFGRSSESVAAAQQQPTDVDDAWGDAPAAPPPAAPRLVATPPSQPTVPIRPPIGAAGTPDGSPIHAASPSPSSAVRSPGSAPVTAPGSGPVGPATRPGSDAAIPASAAAAPSSGSLAAALASPAAPNSVDESFATVPTSAPLAGGARPLAGLSARAPADRSGPLTSVPSVGSLARPGSAGLQPSSALDAEVTESIDTDDPDDPVFGAAIPPPSPAAPALAASAAASAALQQFSDTASVSEPLEAVSASRPNLAFSPGAGADGDAQADADGVEVDLDAADAEPARAGSEPARADSEPARADSEPAPVPPTRDSRDARNRPLSAADNKVEIDPALYAESAIDQSFEANFVVPGGEAPPPNWQPPPQQWDPASAGIAMPPPPDQQHNYGYAQPESSYPPGYDMAFPQAYHTGDETALVMAPDVGRRRSYVIIGSTIFVLLAGAALYLYLDYAKRNDKAPQPVSGLSADASAADRDSTAPDGPTGAVAGDDGAAHGAGEVKSGADATAADGPRTAAADVCKTPLVTKPDGATVLLADEEIGTTPFTASLPCKPVTLTFRKKGFADATEEVSPTAKGEPVSVTLEAAAPDKGAEADKPKMIDLEIVANPANAQIKVGDRELARNQRKISVPIGVKVIVTISKGGRSGSKEITPTAENHKLSITLGAKRGRPRKGGNTSAPPNSLDDL